MELLCRIVSMLCLIMGLVFMCSHDIDGVIIFLILATFFQLHAMDR